MTAQSGKFEARFTYSSGSSSVNTDIAFSDKSTSAFDFLASIRIKSGYISSNGVGKIAFKAGTNHAFRVVFDVATRTYSAYVKVGSGSEVLIGSNIKFNRSSSKINYIALYGYGAFTLSNVTIAPK